MMSSELKRRTFLGNASSLMGTAAFAKLLSADSPAAALPPSPPGLPHFAPKAKRVIYLFLAGGPSHIDLFDYKPALKKIDGQPLPESVRQGQRLTTMTSGQSEFLCVAPKFNFERCGERDLRFVVNSGLVLGGLLGVGQMLLWIAWSPWWSL